MTLACGWVLRCYCDSGELLSSLEAVRSALPLLLLEVSLSFGPAAIQYAAFHIAPAPGSKEAKSTALGRAALEKLVASAAVSNASYKLPR